MPEFEVTITARFVAAHQLRLPDSSYEPLHEHDWRVTVTVAGSHLDEMGVLVDFHPLHKHLVDLLARFQHQNLNLLPAFAERNPSAENVAVCVAETLAPLLTKGLRLACVEIEEEANCIARFHP